jgi:hypothetical protein
MKKLDSVKSGFPADSWFASINLPGIAGISFFKI